MTAFGWILFAALVTLGAWSAAGMIVLFTRRLCRRDAQLICSRPARGRESPPSVKAPRVDFGHGPDSQPSSPDSPLSRSHLLAVPFAAALQPDWDSFFGGMEVAVAAGGVLVIALVVVLSIRKLVSF